MYPPRARERSVCIDLNLATVLKPRGRPPRRDLPRFDSLASSFADRTPQIALSLHASSSNRWAPLTLREGNTLSVERCLQLEQYRVSWHRSTSTHVVLPGCLPAVQKSFAALGRRVHRGVRAAVVFLCHEDNVPRVPGFVHAALTPAWCRPTWGGSLCTWLANWTHGSAGRRAELSTPYPFWRGFNQHPGGRTTCFDSHLLSTFYGGSQRT